MGEVYTKFRPSYPQAFIEYLHSRVGIGMDSVVADIGSGTGILTKQLLDLCKKVFAVEPNSDMRAVAEVGLSVCSNFSSINGTAENTTLDDNCVDFITVAQAFHWFNKKQFETECRRILRPKGKVTLVWNSRDFSSEAVKENEQINKRYCPNFKGFSGGIFGMNMENDDRFDDFFLGNYDLRVFQNDLTFSLDNFIGRALSASYALKEDDENFSAYIDELTESFYRYSIDGQYIMPNITRSYTGTV